VPLKPPLVSLLAGALGSAADAHLEVAVHVELQDESPSAAFLIRGPRRGSCPRCADLYALFPEIHTFVVFDRHRFRARCWARCNLASALHFTAEETGISGTAPGAQQFFRRCVELHNGRRSFAAIRDGAILARVADAVDRLTLFHRLAPGAGSFEACLVVGQRAGAVGRSRCDHVLST